jgi:hypothetical protein
MLWLGEGGKGEVKRNERREMACGTVFPGKQIKHFPPEKLMGGQHLRIKSSNLITLLR